MDRIHIKESLLRISISCHYHTKSTVYSISIFPDAVLMKKDNDKENVDPIQHGLADLSLPLKGDHMKAFIDEEAEVEDGSDNDLMGF